MGMEEPFIQMMTFAKKIRSIANHGMKVRYHYDDIGINSRLDTIQAAILRVKLRYLSQFNEARRIQLPIFMMRLLQDVNHF